MAGNGITLSDNGATGHRVLQPCARRPFVNGSPDPAARRRPVPDPGTAGRLQGEGRAVLPARRCVGRDPASGSRLPAQNRGCLSTWRRHCGVASRTDEGRLLRLPKCRRFYVDRRAGDTLLSLVAGTLFPRSESSLNSLLFCKAGGVLPDDWAEELLHAAVLPDKGRSLQDFLDLSRNADVDLDRVANTHQAPVLTSRISQTAEARPVLVGRESAARADCDAPADVFRPIQYLGSKLRSLQAIADVIGQIAPDGVVADPFSGTSVVAQALAARGHRVLASDVMQFSATFARALLGVGRDSSEPMVAARLLPTAEEFDWYRAWEPWVARETRALSAADGWELIDLSLALPQVWRRTNAGPAVEAQLSEIAQHETRSAVGVGPLAATHYAGTFFGVRQALEIDAIRQSIAGLTRAGEISPWCEAALLTALLAAVSDVAFSAGKHYAQPHAIHRDKDLTFASNRILEDRRKDVRGRFVERLASLLRCARPGAERHEAAWAPMEALSTRHWFGGADVIYADPPYTAQQYSRFYHVPEVLVPYRVPTLQIVNGEVTRGLYPEGRYKSAFSSKRRAPGAFAQLCETAAASRAGLVLSYSASVSGRTGNDRMIELPVLEAICRRYFAPGRVEVIELNHAYRQFNGAVRAVDERLDREYLIVCRAHTR